MTQRTEVEKDMNDQDLQIKMLENQNEWKRKNNEKSIQTSIEIDILLNETNLKLLGLKLWQYFGPIKQTSIETDQ